MARRPAAGPPRPYHFPRFGRRRLTNGLQLIVAPVHELPVVTVMAVVEAGAGTERVEQAGVAALTVRALLEGTRHRDADALADALESLGTSLDVDVDWDTAIVDLTVLPGRLEAALQLLGEVVLEPAFPTRSVERLKAERLAELLQLRTEPRGLATETFERLLYVSGSRYGEPQHGSADSVVRLTVQDLRRFHETRFQPGGMTLVVVGDTTVDEAERLTRGIFGARAAGVPPLVQVSDAPASTARQVHLVRKDDAVQSELRIGHVGLPRRSPEYFPVVVMNAILGGLFSSRINLNLRERHGYTYGAFSSFDWRRHAGPFVVSTAVQSEVTGAAIAEVIAEIERMRAEEVSDEELSLATSYLGGVFPIRYETTAAIARGLAAMMVYDLPPDYFDRYRDHIASVSTADVHRVARETLRPEMLQIVIVGDAGVVTPQLAEQRLSAPLLYDTEGRPISG
ncbi:MAG TPA: pitrilysin family protein [Gemmatimonadaceae bacterium]|nr:pitrilysin family protein [Gemmatimonadaceae bacterium]